MQHTLNFHTVTLEHVLLLAAVLFTLGIVGLFINRKNVIVLLMCLEVMLLAVNINFVAMSAFAGDITGQIFTLFIFAVAAAEVAIGLAILTLFFRNRGSVEIDDADVMKG